MSAGGGVAAVSDGSASLSSRADGSPTVLRRGRGCRGFRGVCRGRRSSWGRRTRSTRIPCHWRARCRSRCWSRSSRCRPDVGEGVKKSIHAGWAARWCSWRMPQIPSRRAARKWPRSMTLTGRRRSGAAWPSAPSAPSAPGAAGVRCRSAYSARPRCRWSSFRTCVPSGDAVGHVASQDGAGSDDQSHPGMTRPGYQPEQQRDQCPIGPEGLRPGPLVELALQHGELKLEQQESRS